jgi:hypothetical protein
MKKYQYKPPKRANRRLHRNPNNPPPTEKKYKPPTEKIYTEKIKNVTQKIKTAD